MILLKILDHDLLRSKSEQSNPIMLEIPAKPEFLPSIVSSTHPGKFIVVRRLTADNRIRSGVFKYDQDSIDNVLPDMFQLSYDLSVLENWNNVFKNPDDAFKYVSNNSGFKSQPHVCLIPSSWSHDRTVKTFGKNKITNDKFNGISSFLYCNVKFPVFLSRPDFVGLYTQFMGGMSSILLHNIRYGMSFFKGDGH